jgi:hypothetical protein
MPSLRSITGDGGLCFGCAAALGTMLCIWVIYRADSYEAAFAWALIGGLLVSFHVYLYDCLLVLLAWCLLRNHTHLRLLRVAFALVTLPIAYLCFLLEEPWVLPILLIVCLVVGAVDVNPGVCGQKVQGLLEKYQSNGEPANSLRQ